MNNVIDEVLAGEPRYNIKTDGGSSIYNNVQIDLATNVTTAGTPLNKALFDSIQADLNTRLLISNKATTSEAQTGTNDVKYTTPKKVQDKLDSLITTSSQSTSGTHTVVTFSNFSNASIISISGKAGGSSNAYSFILNGSAIGGFTTQSVIANTSALTLAGSTNTAVQGFEFRFDLKSNSFIGYYVSSANSRAEIICGRFSSITNFQIRLNSGSTYSATIQVNR